MRWHREGRRDGRWGGDAAAAADLEPAEADGADRRQAVHRAHRRAAARARHGRGRRHARLHAAGDPQLLRRRRVARRQHRVLGRGAAARHRRLGPPREREARRHLPRHLRRRALRRRPRRSRRPAQGDGRGRHDRAQVGRQPARVRDRRHRRRRQGRALPREAVLGPGLLGHDQHRHLRARAGGAHPHPGRRAVRLLEGALPAAARDGPPDLRARDGGLLAGHRQPRPVPAGELRRARRERAPEHRGRPAARQRLDRRGHRHPRRRGDRRPGVHRQPLPDHARRLDRALHRALERRHAARARADDAHGDRRGHARRPQRADRGRDHRPRLRHPRPRADPGGRCDRRRGRRSAPSRTSPRTSGSTRTRRSRPARRSTRT